MTTLVQPTASRLLARTLLFAFRRPRFAPSSQRSIHTRKRGPSAPFASSNFLGNMANEIKTVFAPRRVLIVTKTTRYEMEKRLAGSQDDPTFERLLRRRGTNVNRLLTKHNEHKAALEYVKDQFKSRSVDIRVVERFDYNEENVAWADAVVAAGGDGTFLLAASKITTSEKPVIGINTDPEGSEGHMCLLRKAPMEQVGEALERLFVGDFEWLFRSRIRVAVTCDGGLGDSMQLHSTAMNRTPSTTRWEGGRERKERERESSSSKSRSSRGERKTEELPVLALNEVFVGESLSSRVSYYEMSVDDAEFVKQKNSGLTVCTGSGSTSWYFNINKMTRQNVAEVLRLASTLKSSDGKEAEPESALIERICDTFNEALTFEPGAHKMAFCVRDPIFNATFPPCDARGFADAIRVKSRGYDTHLVVDGGVSFPFNDGADATLRCLKDDSLRTVIFR